MLKVFPAPLGRLPPGAIPPTSITGFYIIDSALTGNWETLYLSLSHIALPALAGVVASIAPITRMTRSAMLDVLEKDYIKAARAAGVPEKEIVKDALKNAMIPILTIVGLSIGFMLSGSIIIEKVFSWPGIGMYALQSMTANDHNPMQAYVLIVGLFFAAVNLVTDLLYGFVDPRIKYS
jgi:peptide/nickel transport system permease protein